MFLKPCSLELVIDVAAMLSAVVESLFDDAPALEPGFESDFVFALILASFSRIDDAPALEPGFKSDLGLASIFASFSLFRRAEPVEALILSSPFIL